jgi:hypothetical protein
MIMDKAICDFLTQTDNLPVALEVAEYIVTLKKDLHIKFWKAYNNAMVNRLMEFNSAWKYLPLKKYRKDWEKSFIVPVLPTNSPVPGLSVVFGQGTQEYTYRFFWGVRWTKPPANFDHLSLTTLQSKLVGKRISIVEGPWWIRWGYYKFGPQDVHFLHLMQNDPDKLVGEISGDVWDLFLEVKALLEEINKAVPVP